METSMLEGGGQVELLPGRTKKKDQVSISAGFRKGKFLDSFLYNYRRHWKWAQTTALQAGGMNGISLRGGGKSLHNIF